MKEVADQAAYEARIASIVKRGHADIAAGNVYRGSEAAFAEIERRTHA